MKISRLAIFGATLFFTLNFFCLVVQFDGRHGGFNLLVYLAVQEFWPFKTGYVFKIFFLLIESLFFLWIFNRIKNDWLLLLLIGSLCLLSWPLLDFSGL